MDRLLLVSCRRPLILCFIACAFFTLEPARAEEKTAVGLRNEVVFAFGGIGYAGTISDGERHLRSLLTGPNAVKLLESALATASPAGQLYALVGLRQKDSAAYRRAFDSLSRKDATVTEMNGCIGHQESFRELVRQIDAGRFDAALSRPP